MSALRRRYSKPGTALVLLRDAATMMGCSRWTARRRLREHIVQKLHRGRLCDFVLLDRVRKVAIPVADDAIETPTELREIRYQLEQVKVSQKRLAQALHKLSSKVGVRL